MNICTKDDVKKFLKITDTDKDEQIVALIPAAQSLIEEYCNREFVKTRTIEYHNGGTDRICLFRYPVFINDLSPIKIYEDVGRRFGDESLINDSDYYVDWDIGIVHFDYFLTKAYGSIKVVYTGGYAIPTTVKTVSRSRSNDIAIITTDAPHGLVAGDTVIISGVGDPDYNGTWSVLDTSEPTKFAYACSGTDEPETEDSDGLVTNKSPENLLLPGALRQVCVELVARRLKTGLTGDIGITTKGTPGGISISFNQADLLPEAKLILDLFRRELSE